MVDQPNNTPPDEDSTKEQIDNEHLDRANEDTLLLAEETKGQDEPAITGHLVDADGVLVANRVDGAVRKRRPHWILIAACWIVLIGFAARGVFWLMDMSVPSWGWCPASAEQRLSSTSENLVLSASLSAWSSRE